MNLGDAIAIADEHGYICETRAEQYPVRLFTYLWLRNEIEEICLLPISSLQWTSKKRFVQYIEWVKKGWKSRYRRPLRGACTSDEQKPEKEIHIHLYVSGQEIASFVTDGSTHKGVPS